MKFTWNINVKHPLTQDAWMKGSGGWWREGRTGAWKGLCIWIYIDRELQAILLKGLVILLWKASLQWWPKPSFMGVNWNLEPNATPRKPAFCAWDKAEQWPLCENDLGENWKQTTDDAAQTNWKDGHQVKTNFTSWSWLILSIILIICIYFHLLTTCWHLFHQWMVQDPEKLRHCFPFQCLRVHK